MLVFANRHVLIRLIKDEFLARSIALETQNYCPISSNLAVLGLFKARIRLTLAV